MDVQLKWKDIIIEDLQRALQKKNDELNLVKSENFILKQKRKDISMTERHLRDKILELEKREKEVDELRKKHLECISMMNGVVEEKLRIIENKEREIVELKKFINSVI